METYYEHDCASVIASCVYGFGVSDWSSYSCMHCIVEGMHLACKSLWLSDTLVWLAQEIGVPTQ